MLSQHALQVVSQHALQGVLSQHALQVVSQHALQGGAIPACIAGGIPACLAGGVCSQGGWLVETLPGRLLRAVRILLECILVSNEVLVADRGVSVVRALGALTQLHNLRSRSCHRRNQQGQRQHLHRRRGRRPAAGEARQGHGKYRGTYLGPSNPYPQEERQGLGEPTLGSHSIGRLNPYPTEREARGW